MSVGAPRWMHGDERMVAIPMAVAMSNDESSDDAASEATLSMLCASSKIITLFSQLSLRPTNPHTHSRIIGRGSGERAGPTGPRGRIEQVVVRQQDNICGGRYLSTPKVWTERLHTINRREHEVNAFWMNGSE